MTEKFRVALLQMQTGNDLAANLSSVKEMAREAVDDATINAMRGIRAVVCCTDRAREVLRLPASIRSVAQARQGQ